MGDPGVSSGITRTSPGRPTGACSAAAHGQADHGEEAAEEREVALQQRVAFEAQLAFVAPHAARLAAGEHDADPHRAGRSVMSAHGEPV